MAVFFGVLEVARERRGIVIDVARAVGHEVLTPAIECVAVRVGEPVRDIDLKLLRPRLVAEYARIRQRTGGPNGVSTWE